MERKVRVKILDSIAGLADPRPRAALDEKYRKMQADMKSRRPKPVPDVVIEETIETTKKRDRYGEPELGFPRDWSFKPDQETMIGAEIAKKWEDAGICLILAEDGKSKAA
jgi:hypothetical protein